MALVVAAQLGVVLQWGAVAAQAARRPLARKQRPRPRSKKTFARHPNQQDPFYNRSSVAWAWAWAKAHTQSTTGLGSP